MTPVDKETLDFYELVERALEGLPPELSALLDNVAIVVDDWPGYSTPLVAEDPEAVMVQALKAGAVEAAPVEDQHGWRLGRFVDPFGHEWEIGRPLGSWPPG